MQKKTKSIPAPLKRARERFENWRSRRKKHTAIPDRLWNEAAELSGKYGTNITAKTLRLNHTTLKNRAEASRNKIENAPGPFVELVAKSTFSTETERKSECQIEVDCIDGTQMKIRLTGEATAKVTSVLEALQWRSL
jgi:hypothetical protein